MTHVTILSFNGFNDVKSTRTPLVAQLKALLLGETSGAQTIHYVAPDAERVYQQRVLTRHLLGTETGVRAQYCLLK